MSRSPLSHRPLIWVVLSLTFSLVSISLTHAQEPTTITLGVPGYMRGIIGETIIADFEAENPDIHVELVDMDQGPSYFSGDDMDTYLDNLGEYVSLADVLVFGETSLIPEATRAGYVLDLMSFVRSDPDINVDDFYPQFWNAFQWDGGMWAFPIAGDVIGLVYDPAAFDEAGLPYPDANWTLADFEMAVRALSEIDPETGEIANSAVQIFDQRAPVILSLLNKPFYDPNNSEALPAFDDPDLTSLVQQWYDLTASGLFNRDEGGFTLELPMVISRSVTRIAFRAGPDEESDDDEDDLPATKLAPLPGGRSLLTVNGVGISAGTQHPDEAYRFIKYLSNSPEAATAFVSALPARRSLVGVEPQESENGVTRVITNNDPEHLAQVEALLATAYSPSETLYAASITNALTSMTDSAYDVNTAFDEQEAAFVTARDTAAARNGTVTINVAVPKGPVELAPGEVAIKFGVMGFMRGPVNETEWDAAIDEFVANNPEVGAVTLESPDNILGGDMATFAESYDCFYQMDNGVPNADLSLLVPLDAYLASDPNYNADDMVSGAMAQVTREGQIWAMPMSIQPTAMWYNPQKVSEAGAFDPYEGWTISDFENTLRALKETMESDTAPFISRDGGTGTYILQLIAAYGGLPLDLSQNPPIIDFASEQTIAATKQVLDLARDGYIEYQPLGQFGMVRIMFGDETVYALYTQSLGGFFNFRPAGGPRGPQQQTITPTYNLVSFPQGTDYIPIAYGISTAYISAQSQVQDACYRFIQSLTKRPGLFGGMPVLRSLLDSDSVIATYGESAVDFYRAVDSTLNDPRAVRFTGIDGLNIAGESLVALWLYRAWDNYYADESVDLTKELQDAQFYADAYLECLALAEQDAPQPQGGLINNFGLWRDCAVKVDPSLEEVLPNF